MEAPQGLISIRRSRPRWVVVLFSVLLLLVLLIVGAIVWIRSHPPVAERASTAALRQTWISAQEHSRADSAVRGASAVDRGHPGQIEVCGFGYVEDTDDAREAFFERLSDYPAQVAHRVESALMTESKPSLRAIGLHLQLVNGPDPSRGTSARAMAACADDELCKSQVDAEAAGTFRQRAAPTMAALVQLAISSRDPAAYRLAAHLCGLGTGPHEAVGPCQLLSLQQWSEIEPGNIVPWLFIAEQARARKNQAALDEAIYRASLGTDFRGPASGLVGLADDALAGRFNPLERYMTMVDLYGTEAAGALTFEPYTQYCAAANVVDANRRQVCERLTQSMIEQGTMFLERSIALRVAEKQLHWPADRIEPLKRESRALETAASLEARLAYSDTSSESTSCTELARKVGEFAPAQRSGQLAYARLKLKESGLSLDQLIAKNASEEARLMARYASTPYSATPPPAR